MEQRKVPAMSHIKSLIFTVSLLTILVLQFLDAGAVHAGSVAAGPPAFQTEATRAACSAGGEAIPVTTGFGPGQSCTIVYAADDDIALAGNNEDWTGLFAKIHFIPASDGKFGRVYFGFDNPRWSEGGVWPQGGMNEQGLFYDGASAEYTPGPRDTSKSDQGYEVCSILKLMEECSTVDEAIARLEPYDCSRYLSGHFLIGDRYGNSAIIEPSSVIKKTGRYQVITNFLQSQTPPETSQDPRYRLGVRLLEESDDVSVELIRRVLSATHWEEYSGSITVTLYSYICDLKRGDIYVHNFHDYDQAVKINLQEELAKGDSVRTIASLFPYETFAEKRYKAWRIFGLLYERAVENGLEGPGGMIAYYHELRSAEDPYARYEVSEVHLNALGYRLLGEGKTELAIGVLEFCVAEHPESANAYDSLGEAYAAAGRKELAIRSYEKSLELDPGNENARRMLEDLPR
jgi:hypothetical protein